MSIASMPRAASTVRKIQLTVLDDQGEPSKAAANAKRL
jgi:hypothetical protein